MHVVVDDLRTFEFGRAKVQNTVFRQLFNSDRQFEILKVSLKSRGKCILRMTEIHPFHQ